ncbi:Glycoside hydrolase family 64 protein [Pleurostoma richardsiae]|uniref:Glycoside hydrolase family 64 protein n=1 Tax=Pleurostoma richardsiae TaxID=41990 RepID=A0AA38RPN5_9PEZI|nr:Glycoside hydrolase family 64 protein [Pleurostoma richardsiae]
MATLDDVLQIQKDSDILMAPTTATSSVSTVQHTTQTSSTVPVAIQNNTGSSNAYAYVTGLDVNNSNAVFLLESDAATVYYPTNPPSGTTVQPLQANCAIPLGAPGSTKTLTVPQTAGGRIWIVTDSTLTFALNPGDSGPALVEPSATNTTDANYNLVWSFCEFTFNSYQLFVNISYVDFVSIPIALQLENTSGTITTVEGMPADGLDTVCSKLRSQDASDGAGWSKLIVQSSSGANLRVLNPTKAISMDSTLFQDYWQPYVDQVWAKYASADLTVDTQGSWGSLTGRVTSADDELTFSGVGGFAQPSSADIFSCNSGAFGSYADNTDEMGNITARLAAAFNRSTLLINTDQPDGEVISTYYTNAVTNHYSRVCHEVSLDGRGYAFAYDDVGPSDGVDQSGSVFDPSPQLLTVTVGGPSASSKVRLRDMARGGSQLVGGRRAAPPRQHVRRAVTAWTSAEDEKRALAAAVDGSDSGGETMLTSDVDLEKGRVEMPPAALAARSVGSLVPEAWQQRAEAWMARVEASPLYARAKPALDVLVRCVVMFLSLSVRALVSRASMALFLVLLYWVVLPLAKRDQESHQMGIMVDPVSIAS